ncbi:MAG: hypothetical protein ACI8QS_000387 [Planctomycetota bacterium]|jgi:hypothetical protein
MNRTAILFLALAVLLAHMLAIHQTPSGEFAPPYDIAHVAFRLGRNLIHEGALTWNHVEGIYSSYPSLLWVALCAFAERLYISPILVTQAVGMACTLGSVVVLTQFSMERRSGLIAPLLLATSGCAAAAGTSGTEASLSMLLLTTAMLGFERRKARTQTVAGVLLAMSQPTAIWALGMLLILELIGRPRDQEGQTCRRNLVPALTPFVVLASLAILRHFVIGAWLAPTEAMLVDDPFGQLRLGLAYIRGFILGSGSAPLVLIPLLLLLTGKSKKGHGHRALMVSLAWFLGVAMTGGSELPFWNALAPALPLLFIAIQNSFTRLIDWQRALQPAVALLLVAGGLASMAVSKIPGSLGPLQLEGLHRAWMTPSAFLQESYDTPHGRMGLLEEIRRVERLRQVGLFARDELPKGITISSAWPGAIGYLSRRPVHDLLGRTNPLPNGYRTLPWTGCPQANLGAAFGRLNDYLISVPAQVTGGEQSPEEHQERLRAWLGRPGNFSAKNFSAQDLISSLAPYEPVSVPVITLSPHAGEPDPMPALMLRLRSAQLTPEIRVEELGEALVVLANHHGHAQVVDLSLCFETAAGAILWMRPNGEWIEKASGEKGPRARTDLMLSETGPRSFRLARFRPPSGYGPGKIRVQLLDPDPSFSWPVGDAVSYAVE